MPRRFLLFVLLISCEREVSPCLKQCFTMTISDSIPVQFWLNGEQSFNHLSECGLTEVCFCQPFQCDDELVIQFQDDSGNDYLIQVVDSNDQELYSESFIKSGTTYSFSFVPSDEGICEKIQIKIKEIEVIPLSFENEDFIDELSPWVNDIDSNEEPFSHLAVFDYAQVNATGSGSNSGYDDSAVLWQERDNDFPVGEYEVQVRIENNSGNVLRAYLVGEFGGNREDIGYQTVSTSVGFQNIDLNFTTSKVYEKLGVQIRGTEEGLTSGIFVYLLWVKMLQSPGDQVISTVASSDCLDIRTHHDCTKLIGYTNANNFDGINYQLSPPPTFYLRVPAQFYKHDNPQAENSMELANGRIVTTRQTIQQKKLFEVGYLPAYMHLKLQKVLMHQQVTIDGRQWKRRDVYESVPVENYPLKKASVWLTSYNSVKRNVI